MEKVRTMGDVVQVVLFDGELARNRISTDIDIILANFLICYFGCWPFVREGEVWIDIRNKKEAYQLLKMVVIAELNTGKTYLEEREKLKLILNKEKEQNFSPKVIREHRLFGLLKIKYVDGEQIRKDKDGHFSFGGHHEVYDYIPNGEFWIDVTTSPTELQHILVHELVEWVIMFFLKRSYDFAHNFAIVIEEECRRILSGAAYRGEEKFQWRHYSDDKLIEQLVIERIKLRRDWYDKILNAKDDLKFEDLIVIDEKLEQLTLGI